jgi:hypothetical protein
MNMYVDSIDGMSALISLSNKRFTEDLKSNLEASDKDPYMNIVNELSQCYYNGAVKGKCGRRVISSIKLLQNLQKTLKTINFDTVNVYEAKYILKAAFNGIHDNCAFSNQDGYAP